MNTATESAHLTSALEEDYKGGFELYVFEVASTYLQAAADKMRRLPEIPPDEVLKWEFSHLYTKPEKPSNREIATLNIEPALREGMIRVTMTIRRGHWEIAKFLRTAPLAMVTFDAASGEVRFYSEGELVRTMPKESLP